MKKNTNYENRKTAFTLAETLITVVILGILVAILVPNLIKNQVENANRTKVKKAMAAYEKAINYMIIENDIKSTEALRELGQDNCQYTREYFKTVKDGSNNCIFKTADRVWWDITDITNPIISLKDEITDSNKAAIRANALSLEADTTSFALIGRFDEVGTLRVNDNAYEQGLVNNNNNKKFMAKLWSFATNTNVEMVADSFALCKANNVNTCTITNSNGEEAEYETISITQHSVSRISSGSAICIYDRENNKNVCNYTSSTIPGNYYIKDYGITISEEEAKSQENCASSTSQYCTTSGDYWEAAKRKCESEGARLPNLAELQLLGMQRKLVNSAWSSEEYTSKVSAWDSNYAGGLDVHGKSQSNRKVICIGIE